MRSAVTLPPGERLASAAPAKQPDRQPLGHNLCFLMFATLLVWSFSALYLIAFPLHLAEQPTLSADWSGVLFGLAAALEIPIMLLSAGMLKRWGKKTQSKWNTSRTRCALRNSLRYSRCPPAD